VLREPLLLTLAGAALLGVSSVTFSQVFAYARDLLDRNGTPPSDVPLTMNVVRLCFALAWTFGPAVAAWVMATFAFVGLFLAAALLFALFTAVTLFFVPEIPPSEESRKAALALPLGVALREPRLLGFFLAFVLYFACSTMGMMNMPLLITEELGGSSADVGIAYSVAPFFELPFMLYVCVLAARIPPGRIIAASLVLGTGYYAGLSLVTRIHGLYLLQIASAAIVAVMSGIAITFFQGFLPAQTGSATNLYASATRIGSILGYLTFGAMAERLGHRAVFAVCAAATGVSFLGTLVAQRRARDSVTAPAPGV
jgi:SET family sugar efflux transporter-like MFS transporter